MAEIGEVGIPYKPNAPKRGAGAVRIKPEAPKLTRRALFTSAVSKARAIKGGLQEEDGVANRIKEALEKTVGRRDVVIGGTALTTAAGAALTAKELGINPWELLDVLKALGQTSPSGEKPQFAPAPSPETSSQAKPNAFEMVFSELNPSLKKQAADKVQEMREVITSNPSYKEMYEITKKWEGVIRQNARRVGIPEELALGIVFIENGGGEDLTSSAKARGVAQLMPETAKHFGLKIDDEVDERSDPKKSIRAMCDYLKEEYDRFGGNLGLMVWAYHAGAFNIRTAQDEFAGTVPKNWQNLVEKGRNKVNIHVLFMNPEVKKDVLSKLQDETELYTYKAVAASELFAEGKKQEQEQEEAKKEAEAIQTPVLTRDSTKS